MSIAKMDGLIHALDLHTFVPGDLLIVLVLVVLEGLLSCDNAVVLALLVKHLPPEQRGKALRYGIIGAYIFRIIALSLATVIMRVWWLKVVGGLYLLWLAIDFFRKRRAEGEEEKPHEVKQILGLSVFWSTVVSVEMTDIVFSVDSIAAAVALSSKLYILILGGLLGILAMRFAAQGFLVLLEKFPRLEAAAFMAVGFIGLKLILEMPVDVLGQPVVPLAANTTYSTAAEYRAAVDAQITPVIDLAHAVRINSAAPPAPDPQIMTGFVRAELARTEPTLTGAALEEKVAALVKREIRDAESAWNLDYRPLIHMAGPVSSAIVLLIFGFGFLSKKKD